MLKMLRVRRGEKGFTLIELLIVVAIIGILAAVAIPQFSAYRIRGFNSAAQSDGKNLVTAQEAAFVDFAAYLQTDAGGVVAGPAATVPGQIQGGTNDGVNANFVGAKLSNNVIAKALAENSVTLGSFFTIGTANNQGDTIFGFESSQGTWKRNSVLKPAGTTWDGAQVADAFTLTGAFSAF